MELKELIQTFKKRFWLILAAVALGTGATGLVTFYYITPQYEASSKLIVNKLFADESPQPDVNSINTNIMLINTYKEIIQSTAVMDKVVQRYPNLNVPAETLVHKVRVHSVRESQIMTLTVKDANYGRAAEIVNAVAAVFQEEIPKIMNVDNVTILDKAKPGESVTPVSPNMQLHIAVGFALSLLLGIAVVFLLEYLDDTLKNEAEVEQYLGLPTLGVIMKIQKKDLNGKTVHTEKNQAGEQYATVSS
ncbi:Wzz/FepE/Etk N-terminal domain-containing protein [Paenibacillus sp. MSJ-34]|uniref:YveK family protein n=1 Tax=Paenibacillus sp. MSJ-34 TaxID=2841529 RepID=UPI001C0FF5B1|nr:lipopolysaccharide biosynthesis protein [Paenibacillus sp. MSJ-34]